MSAKNQGAPSIVADNYPTVPSIATRLLESCEELRHAIATGEDIYEIQAGDGAILRVLLAAGAKPSQLHAYEIRPECEAPLRALGIASVTIGDALHLPPPRGVVLTNPSFVTLDRVASRYRESRLLILLGRASWMFGADCRYSLLRRIGIPTCRGLPERPSFVRVEYRDEEGTLLKTGSNDNVGCAWFSWSGLPRDVGATMLLREETEEEKKYVPPRRIITVRAEDWAKRGKKATIVHEEMTDA